MIYLLYKKVDDFSKANSIQKLVVSNKSKDRSTVIDLLMTTLMFTKEKARDEYDKWILLLAVIPLLIMFENPFDISYVLISIAILSLYCSWIIPLMRKTYI